MSWDFGIYLRYDLNYDVNCTYNVSPMFYKAFNKHRMHEGIRSLHGISTLNAIPELREAIGAMKAEPEVYRAMNPTNGWGDYASALALLEKLLAWCKAEPDAYIAVE